MLASWPWIYYFIAIVCIPLSIGGLFLIPNVKIEVVSEVKGLEPRQPKMDWLVSRRISTPPFSLVVLEADSLSVIFRPYAFREPSFKPLLSF